MRARTHSFTIHRQNFALKCTVDGLCRSMNAEQSFVSQYLFWVSRWITCWDYVAWFFAAVLVMEAVSFIKPYNGV